MVGERLKAERVTRHAGGTFLTASTYIELLSRRRRMRRKPSKAVTIACFSFFGGASEEQALLTPRRRRPRLQRGAGLRVGSRGSATGVNLASVSSSEKVAVMNSGIYVLAKSCVFTRALYDDTDNCRISVLDSACSLRHVGESRRRSGNEKHRAATNHRTASDTY